MSSSWMSIALSVLLLACVACQGSPPKDAPANAQSQKSDKAAPEKAAPEKATPEKAAKAPEPLANGCPLVIQKVTLKPKEDGSGQRVFMDAFNTAKDDLHNHSVAVRFTDKDGKIIKSDGGKDFVTTTLSIMCKAEESCELFWPFAPANAHAVEVKVFKVRTWKGDMPKTVWELDWDDLSGQWPK